MGKEAARLDADEKLESSGARKPPTDLPLSSDGDLDPQGLFELVSKHYNSWLNVIDKQFEDDDNFLPFPNEDMPSVSRSEANGSQQPIFDYSLLEALDKVSSELAQEQKLQNLSASAPGVAGKENVSVGAVNDKKVTDIKKMEVIERIQKKYLAKREQERRRQQAQMSAQVQVQAQTLALSLAQAHAQAQAHAAQAHALALAQARTSGLIPARQRRVEENNSLLEESEINYLQDKIAQIFKSNQVGIPKREGFSLYDTKDEEGLHEGNAESDMEGGESDDIEDVVDESQNDYDIGEVLDSMYYDYHPTHHIEVELNTENGQNNSRTVFNNQYDYEDDGGPSCEFTFEYDPSGKLIPTHSNVEEKLRLMNLESRMRIGKMLDQQEEEILQKIQPGSSATGAGSSKKKKKNKNKNKNAANEQLERPNPGCCLLCEYETIYGTRPKQMIKWYDQKMRQEQIRREEIRKKLENAKLKALRKQRELRQRQHEQMLQLTQPQQHQLQNEHEHDHIHQQQLQEERHTDPRIHEVQGE